MLLPRWKARQYYRVPFKPLDSIRKFFMPRETPPDAPPIVLCFGLADPTGASGLQADLLTLASMGCHGVTVLTGYTVSDSAGCDEVTSIDPETVATQARKLLEDMPVAAFKIGAATRAEIVSAIAEVVADYDDIPLILVPDFTLDDEHVLSADELREAIAELLAPQTTVLVADRADLLQLAQPDSDAEIPSLDHAITELISQGCEYILSGDTGTSQTIYTLHGEEGQVRQDSWDRESHRILGNNDTLAAAIAALLANGLEPPDAIREAQEYLYQVNRHAFRPGMGAYIPDRFFWAKVEDKDADSDDDAQGLKETRSEASVALNPRGAPPVIGQK